MSSGVYNYFKAHLMDAEYNLGTGGDVVKVGLLSDVGDQFVETHDTKADLLGASTELAAAGGYSTGGETLVSKAVSIDDAGSEGMWDAADLSWTSATFTAYHAFIYDSTHASDALICLIDFEGAQTVTSGTFTISWDAEGIINIA